jgi:hypothetical protein
MLTTAHLEQPNSNLSCETGAYHQSNGRAEAAIKSMKKLVIGSTTEGQPDPDELAKAILLFRNAPRYGGASPATVQLAHP